MARPKAMSVPLESMGFPGYVATRAGAVLSLKYGPKPKPLKPGRHNKSGRLMVQLYGGKGRGQRVALARLILTAFGQPSPKGRGYEPHHRNGDTDDCRLANLRWRKKATPDRERAVKLIRGLMRKYQIAPEELA